MQEVTNILGTEAKVLELEISILSFLATPDVGCRTQRAIDRKTLSSTRTLS